MSGDNQSTLPFEKFANANIHINEVCCYGTVSVSKESFLSSWNFEDKPLACVFFSPSGVRTVTSYLENLEWESVKVFAIGETTANALLSQTPINRCDGVPSQFNLEGIKSMLLQYFNH